MLAGRRTVGGKPLLAADPHLPSQIPSIFYRVHLQGGRLNAIGSTALGLPGLLMGHNGRIAWGWTNANADVQDLYIEKTIDGEFFEYEGRIEPLDFRREVIKVKGAADVVLTVRSTGHGPLVSDLIGTGAPALALRWTGLNDDDDAGLAAYLDANRATNWKEFTDAFRTYPSHAQNMLFADADGNIAYVLAGTIPIRAAGDGTAPVPGWTSAYEWKGYIPFDRLPTSLNPRRGYLASANNKIAPDTYPYTLGSGFAAPYRAARVEEVLSGLVRFKPEDLERLQADIVAVHARELMPLIDSIQPAGKVEARALELLKRWDLRMAQNSPAAAIFAAWYIQLAESLFADELGEPLWRTYSDQLHMVSMAMASAVRGRNQEWCDDVRTITRERCTDTASAALSLALARMASAQGSSDPASWQWGKVHHTVFAHAPFDLDPALAKRFNRTIPSGGDKHTVNVASNPRWTDYNQRHIALYRQIIDLDDFSRSRWMAAPGQSGVVTDEHYDDLIEPWRNVEYRPMRYRAEDIDQYAAERIQLRP